MVVVTKEDLQNKSVVDLKKIAKKLGIKNYSQLKKSEIIVVISKHPFNKSGTDIVVPSEPKKKNSTRKKKNSTPKKKDSPGILDRIKGFFSSPAKAKKAKKPKAVKEPSAKAVKAKKPKAVKEPSEKPKKAKKPKAVKEPSEKKTTPKPVSKRGGRRVSKKRVSISKLQGLSLKQQLENIPKIKNPIVIQELNNDVQTIKAVAPFVAPVPKKLATLAKPVDVVNLSPIKKPLVKEIVIKPTKKNIISPVPKKLATLDKPVEVVNLSPIKKPLIKEIVIKPTKKNKAKTIKKIDINLPSGKKASVLEIPSLRSTLAKEQIENIDPGRFIRVNPVKKRQGPNQKTIAKKISTIY
jgi:hypothetical protein